MKKSTRIIILIILGILITFLSIYTIDIVRFNKEKKPLITFKTKITNYSDGDVTEYYSLGYKFIKYNREWLNDYEKDFIFNGLKNDFTEQFEIATNTYTPCTRELELYTKSIRNYYLSCVDNILISFRNGVNKDLKEALEEGMLTIYDVTNKTNDKKLYSDGGSTMYTFNNFKILICNKLNTNNINKNVVIGDSSLDINENLCEDEYASLIGVVSKVKGNIVTLTLDEKYQKLGQDLTFTTENKNTYKIGDKLKIYYNGQIENNSITKVLKIDVKK